MKIYIMFTGDIHPIGGMQLYTAGKAQYLEKRGWKVVIFYNGDPKARCEITYLNQYNDGAFPFISNRPAQMSVKLCNLAINRMCNHIDLRQTEAAEILIESQADTLALWGELLAERLGAQHVCFNCNELFRGVNKYYEENIDFFIFKYRRKELLGLHQDTLRKIFDGYMEVTDSQEYLFDAVEPEPIQDVLCEKVEKIENYDYNIAYLGRAEKKYVHNIIIGVMNFARKHPDKSIQFIIIGNADCRTHLLQESFGTLDHVVITLLGNLVPIPRSVYKKIDVMIAGAVCAEISARENVPTIVADCENFLANGVLGYTVHNSMYHEHNQSDFCAALENVLITKEYLRMPYSFPDMIPSDDIYESHFEFYKNASCKKEYFPVEHNKNVKKMFEPYACIKVCFPYFYWDMRRGLRKILHRERRR